MKSGAPMAAPRSRRAGVTSAAGPSCVRRPPRLTLGSSRSRAGGLMVRQPGAGVCPEPARDGRRRAAAATTMGPVDGTRELMRHDLEVWPAGRLLAGRSRPSRHDAPRLPCRRRPRAPRCWSVGGIAWRAAPWRDWLGAAGDAVGVDVPGATRVTRRDFRLDSRYVDEPVDYSIAWPPGSAPGDPLPVCFALPGRGGDPPMGFADFVAAAVRRASRRRTPWSAWTAASRTGTGARPARTGSACCWRSWSRCAPAAYKLGGGGRGRAIIGWSMGGYGALLAAETQPKLFDAVVAAGPRCGPATTR